MKPAVKPDPVEGARVYLRRLRLADRTAGHCCPPEVSAPDSSLQKSRLSWSGQSSYGRSVHAVRPRDVSLRLPSIEAGQRLLPLERGASAAGRTSRRALAPASCP